MRSFWFTYFVRFFFGPDHKNPTHWDLGLFFYIHQPLNDAFFLFSAEHKQCEYRFLLWFVVIVLLLDEFEFLWCLENMDK